MSSMSTYSRRSQCTFNNVIFSWNSLKTKFIELFVGVSFIDILKLFHAFFSESKYLSLSYIINKNRDFHITQKTIDKLY
jgi:hypothetical protein